MSQTRTYQVRGMTCAHCARAVTSSTELATDVVRDAVQRAGYKLVGAASR